MKATVHLREGSNLTNARSEAIGRALEAEGVSVRYHSRGDAPQDSDLVIQTGFAETVALNHAIDTGTPYLIMEAPFWRDFYDVSDASSWAYNGLAGGGWHPPAPDEKRPSPALRPMREGDKTLIIGQKPTDHSLRGSDHVKWILDTRTELPEADFRPHPLMAPPESLRPINEALDEYQRVVSYTSTVGAEALVAGCEVRADHRSSLAYGVDGRSRESWHHENSWKQASHHQYYQIIEHILSGYDEARCRAEQGLVERPRGRIDGQAVCERYYRAGL